MANDNKKGVSNVFENILNSRRAGSLYAHPDDDGLQLYPVLWEFLTRTYVDEETYKDPAKLSITLSSGGFAVELVDGALGLMVNTTSERLTDAFRSIETALTSPNPPIRYFKDQEVKLKKRPKKTKKEES